ncbi:MAG TPA: hypothetical protein VH307_31345 [Streptosporangiaceae bacterium]|nr:hypothetical protein [Streptosporangiaceae bacterium]
MATKADRWQQGNELCKRMVYAGYSREQVFYALIKIARENPELAEAALAEAVEEV